MLSCGKSLEKLVVLGAIKNELLPSSLLLFGKEMEGTPGFEPGTC